MTGPELTVVCADGDRADRAATTDAIEAPGISVRPAASVEEVEAAIGPAVDCVVTGFSLADGDAYDVVDVVRDASPDISVIVFTDVSPGNLPRPDASDVIVEYVGKETPEAHDRLRSLLSQVAVPGYQVAYPVPADERERIEALQTYDLDGLAATDAFDRLTKLVVSHFDIDVAFVGLVDEHEERFVACEGANWETLAREDSICTHTILSEDVMVVEDVREDPRFSANDTLVELDIRSYAGVRLTTPDGHAIGALCCTADEPRRYTDDELADLELFGEEAMEQLLLRKRLNERTEAL